MFVADAPPLWLPPKPAIVRADSLNRHDRRQIERRFGVKLPPAQANLPGIGGILAGLLGEAAADATITYTDKGVDGADGTTYSFTGKSFGTASADRYIIVGVGATSDFTNSISSLTIGGVTATQRVYRSGSLSGAYANAAIFIAAVPTGTTGTVAVTWASTNYRCSIGVWATTGLTGAGAATDTDSGAADPTTVAMNCDAGGVMVGYGHSYDAGADGSHTWTNLTENFDELVEGGASYHTGACAAFASAQSGLSVTCDPANVFNSAAFVFASFR